MDTGLAHFLEKLAGAPGWRAGAVLDVRCEADFCAAHLRGAVNLPLAGSATAELETRLPSIFLPPRERPLLLIASDHGEASVLASRLAERGRPTVTGLCLAPEWAAHLPASLRAVGPSRDHLWEPPRWLREHVGLLPPPAAGPVLDLGCGSGRAAVWLADRGYRVTGIDWQPEALSLGRRLAASRGVTCSFQEGDLRNAATVPSGPWRVVLNFRFLQRALLDRIPRLLTPGGVILVRTFRQTPGYTGHPQSRHRLAPGELLRHLPLGLFTILAHEEGHDPDGRPAAGIVARLRNRRRPT